MSLEQQEAKEPRTINDEQIAAAMRFGDETIDNDGHISGVAARREAGASIKSKQMERWLNSRKDEVAEAVGQYFERAKAVASKVVRAASKIHAKPGSCKADDFDPDRKDRRGSSMKKPATLTEFRNSVPTKKGTE